MTSSLLLPIRHVARVAIEALTPISIASGGEDADFDAPLFRDWNGLPCLAGTTLAGVLRALHTDYYGEPAAKALFGEAATGQSAGRASGLMVSFGLVHDKNGRAVDRLLAPGEAANDDVLRLLCKPDPLLRDSVAIDGDSGAAAHGAKFDRTACPIGTRFSFEIAIDGEAGDGTKYEKLREVAALLTSPYARFGGATRRGLGRVKVVRACYAAIDRSGAGGRERWIAYREAKIDERPTATGLSWADWSEDIDEALAATSRRAPITAKLTLTPQGFWRLGQGEKPWTTGEKTPNAMPLADPVIRWPAGNADVKSAGREPTGLAPLVSAGLKGAIAHRAEFHLRRIRPGQLVDANGNRGDSDRLMDALFGKVGAKNDDRAGALLIDDALVNFSKNPNGEPAGRRMRNSLDRHTGGTRNGKLFTLEAHWKGPDIVISITVLAMGADGTGIDADVVRALDWAIEDLCQGRLAIGAGDAVGDGVMEGKIVWSALLPTLGAALGLPKQEAAA